MMRAFQAGGWAMFFVLAFGLVAVLGAARFLWKGEAGIEPFTCWMLRTTWLSAVFGFLVGLINVANYIGENSKTAAESLGILIEGTGESLNNLTLGLLLMTLSSLLLALGQRRFPTPR